MKNPVELLVAVSFVVLGAIALVFPQWCYKAVTPEQATKDRKQFRASGVFLLLYGAILLVFYFQGS